MAKKLAQFVRALSGDKNYEEEEQESRKEIASITNQIQSSYSLETSRADLKRKSFERATTDSH